MVDRTNREPWRPLASDLARLTGEREEVAIANAVRERLERLQHGEETSRAGIAHRLLALGREFRAAPVLDPRPLSEIERSLYDENGLPR